jgi:DNA-binding HxlR family transcriptional regulator
MDKITNKKKTCVNSLKLLGDFWTLRIIEALSNGENRFCGIQRAVGNVNPVTLTNRLDKLVQAGMAGRKKETYFLTKIGKNSLPVLDAIVKFAKKIKRF